MNVTTWILSAAVGCTALTGVAAGQVAPDAKQVFDESAQAMNKLEAMTYKVKKNGTGAIKDIIDVDGTVKFWRMPGAKQPMVRISGKIKNPGAQDQKIDVSYDGVNVVWLDWEKNTLYEHPMSDSLAREDLEMSNQFLLPEFKSGTAYQAETGFPTVNKKGVEKINGEMCDVVSALPSPDRQHLWAISVADRLPRQFEQGTIGADPKSQIGWVTNISDLKSGMKLTADDFKIEKPVGFIEDRQKMAAPGAPAELGLKSGSVAPELPANTMDTSGKEQSLASHKNEALVLQFFGTMFRASVAACAETQVVADEMKDKKVAFIGVACRELSDTAAADFWKANKFSFPLIAKGGDDIAKAYKVAGYPSVVVVGANGTITGFFQDNPGKDVLANAIRAGLPR